MVGGAYSSVDLSFAGPDGKRQTLRSYASDTSAFILKLTPEGNVEYLRGPLALQLQYITAVEIDDSNNVYAGGFYLGAVYFGEYERLSSYFCCRFAQSSCQITMCH